MASSHYDKLPPDWAKLVHREYAAGASDTEVRATLRMTKSLWDALMQDAENSQFKEIIEFGRTFAKAWWLTQARSNLQNRSFNANLWMMVMKNLYGFSEKSTVVTKEEEALSNEELDERIQQAMDKYTKANRTG